MRRLVLCVFLLCGLYVGILGKAKSILNKIDIIKESDFAKIEKIYEKNGYYIAKKDDFYGILNNSEKIVLDFIYKEIYIHKNGNILIKNKNDQYISKLDGKIIDVEKIYPSTGDYLIYEKNDKFGIIRLRDMKIQQNIYTEIEFGNYRYFIASNENKKYTIIDPEIDEVKNQKYIYDYIQRVGLENFIGGTDEVGNFAYIYKDLKKRTKEKYNDVKALSSKYYLGEYEEGYDLLSYTGKILEIFKENEFEIDDDRLIIIKGEKQKEYKIGNF